MEHPFENLTAYKKWLHLKSRGYKLIHFRTTGIIFGTSEKGEAGHIDWWGKVTWVKES